MNFHFSFHDGELGISMVSLFQGQYLRDLFGKLHHYYEDNKFELYDIEKDVSESENLSEIKKEKKNELLIDLNNWRKTNNAPIPNRLNPYYDQKYVDSLMFLIDKNLISGKVNKNE